MLNLLNVKHVIWWTCYTYLLTINQSSLTINILQFDWLWKRFCSELSHPTCCTLWHTAVVTSGELDGVAIRCCYGYLEGRRCKGPCLYEWGQMNTYRAKVRTLHDCNGCDICAAATYGCTCTQNGSHVYGPHTIIINLNKRYTYVLYKHKWHNGWYIHRV